MLFKPKIGLALGGGGARGGAHIGILRILKELDIHIEAVAGTSAGGMVAGMVGSGWSLIQMQRFFFETNFAEMVQLDRSGSSLISLERFEETLYAHFGDLQLEMLKPRVAMMAADIRSFRPVMLTHGPVVKAILATIAVPGLFPPIEWDNHLLVDGGVVDNVPTQATYTLGAERIIAVDVNSRSEVGLILGEVDPLSRQIQRALYWLLNLSRRQYAFDAILRSSMLSLRMLEEYHLSAFPPDVLIQPEIGDIGLFDMHRVDEAINLGEKAARELADDLKKLTARRLFPRKRRRNWPSPDYH
jgi:NTE family protein